MTPEVIGKIKHLAVAPVKSAGLLEVTKAFLTPAGVEVRVREGKSKVVDHQLMVVRAKPDQDGVYHFITQRDKRDTSDKPQGLAVMSQIKPQMDGDSLLLTWQGRDPIEVPQDMAGREIPVKIWGDIVNAVNQEAGLPEWLSDHLGVDVKLVKAAGSFHRDASKSYAQNENTVRFQDGYPVHWFFEESVAELSEKAGESVPWQSFRPQLVAPGSPAQAEHLVFAGEIAGIPFTDPKPCDRCPTTNVDQETGKVKVGRAIRPLSTYKKWRNKDGAMKVIFGENMLPQGEGEINVGDEITVTAYRNPALIYGAKV